MPLGIMLMGLIFYNSMMLLLSWLHSSSLLSDSIYDMISIIITFPLQREYILTFLWLRTSFLMASKSIFTCIEILRICWIIWMVFKPIFFHSCLCYVLCIYKYLCRFEASFFWFTCDNHLTLMSWMSQDYWSWIWQIQDSWYSF